MSNDRSNSGEKIPPGSVSQDPAPNDGAFGAAVAGESDSTAGAIPPRKRRRVWKTLGLTTLALGAAATAWLHLTAPGQKFKTDFRETIVPGMGTMMAVRQNPNLVFDHAGSDHVNILLIGRDVNWKIAKVYDPTTKTYRSHQIPDKDTAARSDTMIVVSLDKNNSTMRMVSLPRDAKVHLPPNKYDVRRGKLNAAHAYGGPELLKQTLHDELGLTIHHYALIKFEGFKNLIDEVGGVYVDVIGALKRNGSRGDLKYDDNWGNLHINLKPGKQWLNGQQAHDYVRFRMDLEGDPGRVRRQQSLMRALASRLKTIPPWKLPSVIKMIRQQFETDMSDEEVASSGFFAKDIPNTQKIQPVTMFGVYSTRGSLTLNRPKNKKLFRYIFGPTFNPENFLQKSPSTDEDEIEETIVSNPATRALLVEAGIIKDDRARRLAVAAETATPTDDAAPSETNDSNDVVSPSLTVEEPTVRSSDTTKIEAPSPVERRRRRRVERDNEANASSAEARPRRRRVRRERSEANAIPAREENASHETLSPIPQSKNGSGRSDGETAGATSGESSTGGSSLNVESPIPQPER